MTRHFGVRTPGRGSYNRRLGDLHLIAILLLFALTLFVGATLLFAMQPMVGKMILPLLGGTPAVWSTCMVFFQAALLGGYAYAHASTAWLGTRRQALLHLAVLALPLAVLPLGIEPGPGARRRDQPGARRAARALALGGAALLRGQRHGSAAPAVVHAHRPSGRARSVLPLRREQPRQHAGAARLSAPDRAAGPSSRRRLAVADVALEPRLSPARGPDPRLRADALADGAAARAGGGRVPRAATARAGLARGRRAGDAPTRGRRLRWVALAFVPSSLLLGATTYITTDIAAVPLLWVLPLAIYLLSFILAFGRWPARAPPGRRAATLPVVLLAIFLMVSRLQPRIWITVLWHLLVLLVVALACHGALALDRPSPRHLTEFYLLISVGGVLGGLFNALIAPARVHLAGGVPAGDGAGVRAAASAARARPARRARAAPDVGVARWA